MGVTVIATSRNKNKFDILKEYGADYTLTDDGNLESKIKKIFSEGVSKILELIGPKTLEDSMKCLKIGGICCNTGILGGKEYISQFDPIKIIPNNCYLTSFFSNYPTQEIIDKLFNFIITNKFEIKISKTFHSLEDISDAHELMESNDANGKIIVRLL